MSEEKQERGEGKIAGATTITKITTTKRQN
jgi:hypothetical protein